MKVRRASLNDVNQLVALVNSGYRGAESEKGWTTESKFLGGQRTDSDEMTQLVQQPNACMLVYPAEAAEGQELTGCVYLELQNPPESTQSAGKSDELVVYLGMLTVKPDVQGKGLGKLLLQQAETWIQRYFNPSGKQVRIQMTVITLRHELFEYYERRGFKRTGKTAPFPYGDLRKGNPLRNDLEFAYIEKVL